MTSRADAEAESYGHDETQYTHEPSLNLPDGESLNLGGDQTRGIMREAPCMERNRAR
jgi:hypothetical protein